MNWLKNKLLSGLVGRFGPLISGSISTAVGGSVAASVTFVHDKVSPFWWEWIVFVFHLLPDDIEKYLTPEIIGGGVGFAFYAVLQEWLNQRQAGGIKAIQESHNEGAEPGKEIAVDGVAHKAGETVKAVLNTQCSEWASRPSPARRIAAAGIRSQRGHAITALLFVFAAGCLLLAAACAHQQPESAGTVRTRSSEPGLPVNLSGEWLQPASAIHTAEYNRPAFERLLLSLRPWGEVGGSHAKVRVDESAATLSGSFQDDEKLRFSSIKLPDSYGLGFGGGLEL